MNTAIVSKCNGRKQTVITIKYKKLKEAWKEEKFCFCFGKRMVRKGSDTKGIAIYMLVWEMPFGEIKVLRGRFASLNSA